MPKDCVYIQHLLSFLLGISAGIIFQLHWLPAGTISYAPSTQQTKVLLEASASTQPQTALKSSYEDLQIRYIEAIKNATSGVLYDEIGACDPSPHGCTAAILRPYNAQRKYEGSEWPLVGHTMIGTVRLNFIIKELLKMIHNQVPGDFVEMGTWRGGAIITARAVMVAMGESDRRHVIGFDAFNTITKYGGQGTQEYLSVPQEQVEHNFKKYGLWDPQFVHLVPGMFENTVPKFASQTQNKSSSFKAPGAVIAFLRIDGNFYTSYESSLYYLYERVPVGGIVYFDDIPSHKACLQAWQDFQHDQKLNETLLFAEKGDGSYFRKANNIVVDFRFYRSHGRND
jgi:hypothetical protein